MVKLIDFINEVAEKNGIEDKRFANEAAVFFNENLWFGKSPQLIDGELYVDYDFIDAVNTPLNLFAANRTKSLKEKVGLLKKKLNTEFPETGKVLKQYFREFGIRHKEQYYLLDFLLYALPGEVTFINDREADSIVEEASKSLTKVNGDLICFFLNYIRQKRYNRFLYHDYYMLSRGQRSDNSAYDMDTYCRIAYHLLNENYIRENGMYLKAARDKDYCNAWLYLSLHFVSAIRDSDLVRLPHPLLACNPNILLEKIERQEYETASAVAVLNTVLYDLSVFHLKPSKTKRYANTPELQFHIPSSLQEHFGLLFSMAEAHFRIRESDETKQLIRPVKTYEQISRCMGEEIGDLFLDMNFKARSANKSYLQLFELFGNYADADNDYHVKGYMMAALLRSHKGSYGEFAQTTSVYLKDAKMSGHTPEFVARELFERGVLSFTSSTLLKMIMKDDYGHLSIEQQTSAIKMLDMSPALIERSVSIADTVYKKSVELAKSIYNSSDRKQEITAILHRLCNGNAGSKQHGLPCIMSAMNIDCPYSGRSSCIGCGYEIATEATLYQMIGEYLRLKEDYRSSESDAQKQKDKAIVQNVVAPSIAGMISVIRTEYGDEAVQKYEKMIEEMKNAG